jgi:dTDP-4-amino-4,6-dideoxygalactose transaminase
LSGVLSTFALAFADQAHVSGLHEYNWIMKQDNSATQPLMMVDLKTQMAGIREALNREIADVLDSAIFIGGPKVNQFREHLEQYLNVRHVVPCANGTDALQIALMALDLKPGDEVIVPAFTYVATAEVIGLLGLTPVMTDVDPDTFLITPALFEAAITPRTRAVVPVHLFGQCADMEGIMAIAHKHNLYVVEDNAQAIGADYRFPDGRQAKAGVIGHIGCTSFFPSKNLGCYGDGGALTLNDDQLAARVRMIANHGQSKQYHHQCLGVNSRLDALQAAILNVKLPLLDTWNEARRRAADHYDRALSDIEGLRMPVRAPHSTHVFHQYTLRVNTPHPRKDRDALRDHLASRGVPAMIYYPIPLYDQEAFRPYWPGGQLPATEALCEAVISLPMHPDHTQESLDTICAAVRAFFEP